MNRPTWRDWFHALLVVALLMLAQLAAESVARWAHRAGF